MQKILRTIIVGTFLLSLTFCSDNKSKQKNIPADELTTILVDIHLAEGINSVNAIRKRYKLNKKGLYEMVMEKHGYSKAAVDSTLSFYLENKPEKLQAIYDKVMEELSRIEGQINDNKKN